MKSKVMFICGASALAAMGVVTVHTGTAVGGSAVVTAAGNLAASAASTTPATAVPKAGPTVKATTFVGGDWPGMGAFGEDWAK